MKEIKMEGHPSARSGQVHIRSEQAHLNEKSMTKVLEIPSNIVILLSYLHPSTQTLYTANKIGHCGAGHLYSLADHCHLQAFVMHHQTQSHLYLMTPAK